MGDRVLRAIPGKWGLEYMYQRLSEVIGDGANGLLATATALSEPNAAHYYAAALLALGGTHVTLNFDRGIELAYSRLFDGHLPDEHPARALQSWLRAPTHGRLNDLAVVADAVAFDRWQASGCATNGHLFKLHGDATQPIATFHAEIAGLSKAKRDVLERALSNERRVLVVGYSGRDPDVFPKVFSLLPVIVRLTWAEPFPPEPRESDADPPFCRVKALRPDAIRRQDARAALSSILPEDADNKVSFGSTSDGQEQRLELRLSGWVDTLDLGDVAEALAEMLSNHGDHEAAIAMLRSVYGDRPRPSTELRLGRALTNAGPESRPEGVRYLLHAARACSVTVVERASALSHVARFHESHVRRPAFAIGALLVTTAATDHAHPRVRDERVYGWATLANEPRKLVERRVLHNRTRQWRMLVPSTVAWLCLQRALRISEREGGSGFSLQAQCELAAVTAWIEFIVGWRSAGMMSKEVRDVYRAIGDARGEGHALCQLALVRGRSGNLEQARLNLEEAARLYESVSSKEDRKRVDDYRALFGI